MATLVARPIRKRAADDFFFTTASVMILIIVFIGFAPSYFLRGAIFAHLPSPLVHLHAVVFTSWIVLFVVQSSLVSAGNVRLHRKLGILGAVIAGLMVILGIVTPFGTLRRHAVLPSFFTPAGFLIGNAFGILLFGAFVAVAIWQRNNRPVHKRLMLIANAMLMSPAISRITPIMTHYPFLAGAIPLAFVVALFVFDLATWRRPLAVTVIGGFLLWASDPVSDLIIATPLAKHITSWAQHQP